MKTASRDRRAEIVRLVEEIRRPEHIVVDVGADHGHVAFAIGAIATERAPGRPGRTDVPWVIADGLRPFRSVDVAVIAGMGWRTIADILDAAPRPRWVVAHSPEDPVSLRVRLCATGWRIDDEALAREGTRIAEIIRFTPGDEPSDGATRALGPALLVGDHPLKVEHFTAQRARYAGQVDVTRDDVRRAAYAALVARIDEALVLGR